MANHVKEVLLLQELETLLLLATYEDMADIHQIVLVYIV